MPKTLATICFAYILFVGICTNRSSRLPWKYHISTYYQVFFLLFPNRVLNYLTSPPHVSNYSEMALERFLKYFFSMRINSSDKVPKTPFYFSFKSSQTIFNIFIIYLVYNATNNNYSVESLVIRQTIHSTRQLQRDDHRPFPSRLLFQKESLCKNEFDWKWRSR